jgi:hypothetical protein
VEKVKHFYAVELIGRLLNEKADPDTLALKAGYCWSQDISKRKVRKEFEDANNTVSRNNMHTNKYEVTQEVVRVTFGAPESISTDFERNFIHGVYFNKSQKFFVGVSSSSKTLHEYLCPTPNNCARFNFMCKIVSKYVPELDQLLQEYEQLVALNVGANSPLVTGVYNRYHAIIFKIKKALANYGLSKKIVTVQAPQPLVATGSSNIVLQDVYDAKTISNFVLYMDGNLAYIQCKTNPKHQLPAGRNPENKYMPNMLDPIRYQKSWRADLSKPNTRFQWHDSKYAKDNFRPLNPVAQTLVDLIKKHGKLGENWFDLKAHVKSAPAPKSNGSNHTTFTMV